MKWFLQFFGIGSAVLYMLLVIVDHRTRDGRSPYPRRHCRKYRRWRSSIQSSALECVGPLPSKQVSGSRSASFIDHSARPPAK
jgi:hypothetical protein